MGVIIKQSAISTIYSYIGVVIGFVTSALIMPKIMTTDQIGLIKLIVAVTGVFSGVFSFGLSQLLFRSFPKFENNKEKQEKLLRLTINIALIGSIVAIPIFYLSIDEFFNLDKKTEGFEKGTLFLMLVFLTIVARLLYSAFFGYFRMYNEVVIDAFIQNIFHKVGILILLIALMFDFINYTSFIFFYLTLYFFFPIIIYLYFIYRKKTNLNLSVTLFKRRSSKMKYSKSEMKEFFNLLLFGTLTTIGGSLFLYLDTLMINLYLGESEVGIYGTMFLFGLIVIIPARSLKSISVSILSKSFQRNDTKEVQSIYKKSSITLLVIGGYIFIGVWCNMYSVFGYLPETFQLGKYVVLFIGLGQLFDMMTGVNNEIIATSPKYRLNTYFILFSILVGVVANVILIPTLGIYGAGLATLLTMVCINTIRLIAVYHFFKIHPFSLNTIKIISIIVIVTLLVEMIPNVENYVLNLLLKGCIITLVYGPIIYFMRLSNDINNLIDKSLRILKIKK